MSNTRTDSATFLANLRDSGLLATEVLDRAIERLPATERGKTVARAFVQMGLLTRFQAERLLIGRSSGFVLGQYRILDQLGQGGMGRVFKAEHATMGRTVALKVLAPQHTKTEKARHLFMREVRAAGRLMHPNIVTAHDANEIDGHHYLVMEYIDGPNLDQLVRERGPLPVGMACDIVRQAATGLQHALEQGMVHRDIKPSNVVLQQTGTALSSGYVAKILDFGLAGLGEATEGMATQQAPTTNAVMGTPDYLSPEQAHNLSTVDIRADLYSLGCTFYFLLTGQVPFPGGTTIEKLLRHIKEEPVAVEQLRPDIPVEVANIVRCLMAKQPGHRYQTPADLVLELMPLASPMPAAWTAVNATPPSGGDTIDSTPDTGASAAVLDDLELSDTEMPSAPAEHLPRVLLASAIGDKQVLPWGQRVAKTHWGTLTLFATAGGVIGAAVTAGVLWLLW